MVKRKKPVKNEFVDAVFHIRKLAMERMDRKQRRSFQEQEDLKRGKKPKKNPRIPYNIYQGILRKEKEIQMKEKEDMLLSREATYFNPVHKKKRRPAKRNKEPNTPEVGKYKNGTLFLQKKQLRK